MKVTVLGFAVVIAIASANFSYGALSYGTVGSVQSQNFDSLPTSGNTNAWANDSTLAGWSAFQSLPAPGPNAITNIRADIGSSNTGALYSYGAAGSTERALGSASSGTPGTISYALALKNDVGAPLYSITVGYTGEQWRNGGNTSAQTLSFSYGYGASYASVTTWNNFTALDFTTPTTGASAAALNGNDPANQKALAATIDLRALGTTWVAGSTIWLRFSDINDAGNDHGVAIDNFSVSAVPEPTSMLLASIAGVSGGYGAWRRRKSKKA